MFPANIVSVKSERDSRSDNMIFCEAGETCNVYIIRTHRYESLSYLNVVGSATDRMIYTSNSSG